MYVCMYVCMYVRTYVCMYVLHCIAFYCICTSVAYIIYMYVCMYVCMYICFLPSSQKCSIIFPALKQSSLDPVRITVQLLISFLSKTLERLVSLQLLPYLEQSGLLPSMQSGFRAH